MKHANVFRILCLLYALQHLHTIEKWNEIAEHFYNRWDMSNCVGSIDGKHVRIQCPPLSGSENFNYKKHFSMVLMACCDANYCFTWIEVGDYDKIYQI